MARTKDEEPGIGHNSVAAEQLEEYVERIERMEEEKKGVADDIRDIYLEAKSQGYDAKTIRTVVRFRRMDKEKRETERALVDTYLSALGLL